MEELTKSKVLHGCTLNLGGQDLFFRTFFLKFKQKVFIFKFKINSKMTCFCVVILGFVLFASIYS